MMSQESVVSRKKLKNDFVGRFHHPSYGTIVIESASKRAQKIVLTGGPGVGKSSIVLALIPRFSMYSLALRAFASSRNTL